MKKEKPKDQSNKRKIEKVSNPPKQAGERKFWTSEKLMSLAALIVSAGTMFTITYQNILIREEQHASVRPYIDFGTSRSNNSDSYKRFSYYVTNHGLGPAFIDNVRINYNGKYILIGMSFILMF